jgi:hypothetical protein
MAEVPRGFFMGVRGLQRTSMQVAQLGTFALKHKSINSPCFFAYAATWHKLAKMVVG